MLQANEVLALLLLYACEYWNGGVINGGRGADRTSGIDFHPHLAIVQILKPPATPEKVFAGFLHHL